MYPQKKQSTGEPNNPDNVTNAEHDSLLILTDLLSGGSLDGRRNIEVPMSRALADLPPTPQLNDHCCLALFNQFSLQQQLPLRAVCTQWQAIIEHKCRRMRSLKLFRRRQDVRYYCFDLLYHLNLHEDDQLKLKPIGTDDDLICSFNQFRHRAHLFADITSFVYYDSFMIHDLEHISVMFPQLTSLTLYTPSSPLRLLKSLPHLTSLSLHYLDRKCKIRERPILRQLESFSLCNYFGHHVDRILVQLGPVLTHLTLSCVVLYDQQLIDALTRNPSLTTSVTHLTLQQYIQLDEELDDELDNELDEDSENEWNNDEDDTGTLFNLACSSFVNLVYLRYSFMEEHFLPSLAKLQHLTQLHIDHFLIDYEIPDQLPHVKSVKQLHLSFYSYPMFALNLQTVFPAVELIAIYQQDEDDLDRVRQYMAQFRITCQVTFHVKKTYKFYMGRHRKIARA